MSCNAINGENFCITGEDVLNFQLLWLYFFLNPDPSTEIAFLKKTNSHKHYRKDCVGWDVSNVEVLKIAMETFEDYIRIVRVVLLFLWYALPSPALKHI